MYMEERETRIVIYIKKTFWEFCLNPQLKYAQILKGSHLQEGLSFSRNFN